MRVRGSIRRVFASVRASFTVLRARRLLRRGDAGAAASLLAGCVAHAPWSFSAWFHLGRAFRALDDAPRAAAAAARARDLAPSRFERLADASLRDLAVAAPAPGGGARAVAVPADVGDPAGAPPPSSRTELVPRPARARVAAASLPLGDCRDLDEYARFRSMPPITPAEIESVDWSAVADDLLDG